MFSASGIRRLSIDNDRKQRKQQIIWKERLFHVFPSQIIKSEGFKRYLYFGGWCRTNYSPQCCLDLSEQVLKLPGCGEELPFLKPSTHSQCQHDTNENLWASDDSTASDRLLEDVCVWTVRSQCLTLPEHGRAFASVVLEFTSLCL